MVSLRAIAESLGLRLEWDPQTSVAKIAKAAAQDGGQQGANKGVVAT
ncbi:MAG TPA: stalk domain-containing protein [Brevibacillus sp.]|nr:stalk domain-containing protein [Brevibacillus sp.]